MRGTQLSFPWCKYPESSLPYWFVAYILSSFDIMKEEIKQAGKKKKAKKVQYVPFNLCFIHYLGDHFTCITTTKDSQRSNQYLSRHSKWKWAASHSDALAACKSTVSATRMQESENKTCNYWFLCILECQSGTKIFNFLSPISLTVMKIQVLPCSMYVCS